MPSFEELLRASLQGVNVRSEAADRDLHKEVASAAQVIEKITGGKATLRLDAVHEGEPHVYALLLGQEGSFEEILGFKLDARGYPIRAQPRAVWLLEQDAGDSGKTIGNKEELGKLFAEMASNPDSPLVVKLAFLMRRAQPQ